MHEFEEFLHMEYFEQKELLINITEHELVPEHFILSDMEKKELLSK
jgi:DNA-directed RNA polymerase I, II, and III subunit RPABC1